MLTAHCRRCTDLDMLMESHRIHFTAGIYDGKMTYLFVIYLSPPYHIIYLPADTLSPSISMDRMKKKKIPPK